MAMVSNRNLIDQLGRVSDASLERLRARDGSNQLGGGDVALRFKVGDRVIDTSTGKAGVIRVAEPRAGRAGGLYAITLADARVVMRGEDELTLDQAVVAAPDAKA